MKRIIYDRLVEWKRSDGRKPLLLRGARQTGKTYILKEFGNREYEALVYCNFDEDPALRKFFEPNLKPRRILEMLSIYKKQDIRPGRDLIFFDEIQESNEALNSLKYFHEESPEFHVAAAGSLLGVKVSVPKSFPVGHVTMLDLFPLSFPEFLTALGEQRYRDFIENKTDAGPFPDPFHQELIALLRMYYVIGGMPEAVATFVSSRSFERVRAVQNDILRSYILDFAKHAPPSDIPKLSLIWESVPAQLARENKKFMFSAVAKSARGREYENALKWLEDAGLLHLVHAVNTVAQPLAGFVDRSAFKVFALDVGLLGSLARLPTSVLAQGDDLFSTYKGAFVENFVAQQLLASGREALCYWRSESKQAEVDFLIEHGSEVLPLEVKAGINPKSKSLSVYNERFRPSALLRTTLLNMETRKKAFNIPLYAINFLDQILDRGLARAPVP